MQIRNLTGIRGFAALWVAVFHFQATAVVTALKLGPIIGGGACGVDIFFVLSGFILALTYVPRLGPQAMRGSQFREFLIRRFARIYPLHLVSLLAMIAAWEIASQASYGFRGLTENTAWTGLCNLLLIHAWGFTHELSWNTPSWSVSAEWFAYLVLFPLCLSVLRQRSLGQLAGIVLAAWVGFLCYVFLVHGDTLTRVTTDGAVRIVPEFLGGYLAYRMVQRGRPLPLAWAYAPLALGALCLSLLQPAAIALLLPAVVLLILGLYAGGTWVSSIFGNAFVVMLGEISYSIYMIHGFVLIAANQIVRRLQPPPTVLDALLILSSEIIATIILGYAGYRLLELPSRKALVQWLTNRSRAAPRIELVRCSDRSSL